MWFAVKGVLLLANNASAHQPAVTFVCNCSYEPLPHPQRSHHLGPNMKKHLWDRSFPGEEEAITAMESSIASASVIFN